MAMTEDERHEILSKAMTPILLREGSIGGDRREARFYGGFDVVAEDGDTLYHIRLSRDGVLEVSTGLSCVRHGGVMLDSHIAIRPGGSGTVTIRRDLYESSPSYSAKR